MSKLIDQIQNKIIQSDFIEDAFPSIKKHGVMDEDVLLHSIGCSIWNTLGHELGYSAIVECPAPPSAGNDIRSDSVWFERDTNEPRVLIEFERYDGSDYGKKKLDEKLSNLMEAACRWDKKPELLILSAWSQGIVSAPDTGGFKQKVMGGIKTKRGLQIPGLSQSQFLFNRFFFEIGNDQRLRLQQVKFWELT